MNVYEYDIKLNAITSFTSFCRIASNSKLLKLALPIGDACAIIGCLALLNRVSIVVHNDFLLAAQTGPTPFIHLLARVVAIKQSTQVL